MNTSTQQIVVFTLDNQQFALMLPNVERVTRVVEIVRLPKAPEIVMGIINLGGKVIPVVNIRRRFRLSEREINLSSQIIISHTKRRAIGILVDAVSGVVELPAQKIIMADKILPDIEYVAGIAKLEDGMILIHDIDKFLSLEEEKAVDDIIGSH